MKVVEFGRKDAPVAVLLHGGGLSWWNYREAARFLQESMRVVLPVLDGHAGSERRFTTIEDNACEVIEWIDAEAGGCVAV
ncbi:MAG: alpha/beta fold hydrolase, partial [Candidatus Spyradocola sp.]